MLNDTPQWVAIYTSPRAEKQTAKRLHDLGYETYLPLHHTLHRWSDRWKNVEEPLFFSYLFAKICLKDVVPVRNTSGVSYLVSWKGKPAIIPDKEIEAIRRLMDAEAKVNVVKDSDLKKGKKVRIIGGQFAGMEGELISDCEDGNFGLTITGLNFALVIEIQKALLRPIREQKRKKGIWEKKEGNQIEK